MPAIRDLNRFPLDKPCSSAWEEFVCPCRACANAATYSLESCRGEGRVVVANPTSAVVQIPAQEMASEIEAAVMHATELGTRGENVTLLRPATLMRVAAEIADCFAGKTL